MANKTREQRQKMDSQEKRLLINKYSFIDQPAPTKPNERERERVRQKEDMLAQYEKNNKQLQIKRRGKMDIAAKDLEKFKRDMVQARIYAQEHQQETEFNFSDMGMLSQTPLSLIKYLLKYDYYSALRQKAPTPESKAIPIKFNNFYHYNSIFQYLFQEECTAKVMNEVERVRKTRMAPVECLVRYNQVDDLNMTYLDLKIRTESASPNNGFRFMEIKTSRDLLVLINTGGILNLDTSDNKHFQQKEVVLIGYLRQDTSVTASIQVQVFVPVSESLKRKLNPGGGTEQPWREVLVYPIEKIGTIIREFTALQSI